MATSLVDQITSKNKMEDIIAIKVVDRKKGTVAFLTWGRVFHPTDPVPLKHALAGVLSHFGLSSVTEDNGGPGPGWGKSKPGTICLSVHGSDGKEDAIMADCNAHANTGVWAPFANDCHNKARRCLERNGLTPPPNHRF